MSGTTTPTLGADPKSSKVYSGPDFAGDKSKITLEEWEFKLQNAFLAQGLTNPIKQVCSAQAATTGAAATFLRLQMKAAPDKQPYKTFPELVQALHDRFHKGDEELDATLRLVEIQQNTNESVADYAARFQGVSEKADLDPKTQCRLFIKGLHKNLNYLRRELLETMKQDNLSKLIDKAQLLANQTKAFQAGNHSMGEPLGAGLNRQGGGRRNGGGGRGGRGGRGGGGRTNSDFHGRGNGDYQGGRGGRGGRGNGGNGGRGRGRGNGNGFKRPLSDMKCFSCGEYGHISPNCPSPNNKRLAVLEHEITSLKTERRYNDLYMAAMNVPTLSQASTPVPQLATQPQTGWRLPNPGQPQSSHGRQ
jgi:hypothetical protein